MSNDESEIQHIAEVIDAEEINTWRIIDNIALGVITHVDRDTGAEGDSHAVINMETSDVGGANPMDVRFGLNPGAVESFVGSLCMNMAPDEETARLWYDQIWDILHGE